jgi:AcrR family transcriptional regulator
MADRSRSRRRATETKQLLVDAGVETLLEEGLGSGAEGLTFKRVYDRLEQTKDIRLTNASVIGRAFQTQEAFQAEVLATIAASDSQDFHELSEILLNEVLVRADLSTTESRWRCVSDLCRITGTVMLDTLRSSPVWRVWIGIWALAGSGQPTEEKLRLKDALLASYESIMRDTTGLYSAVLDFLGFRVRAPLTMAQGAAAIQALAEGSALRDLVDEQAMRHIRLPTGADGEPEEWTIFGMGLHTLIRQFIEPDPDWSPPAGPDR